MKYLFLFAKIMGPKTANSKTAIVFSVIFLFLHATIARAQDTTVLLDQSEVSLPAVVVRSNPGIGSILRRIKEDTTFYKAFRTLRTVGYTADNAIEMLDKKGKVEATYHSVTQQTRTQNCRTMKVLQQNTTGDMLDKKGNFNYTTAKMYDGLFFTHGQVCGETNIVSGKNFDLDGKKGMEKHKEQLKMLFFNPGRKIPGIPFIGNKLDVYDENARTKYNYRLDTALYQGRETYRFTIAANPDASGIVIERMTTWFDHNTMEVLGRNYTMRYSAGIYSFNVEMQVSLNRVNNVLLPVRMHYKGNWGIILKGSERGEFTANLHDFKME